MKEFWDFIESVEAGFGTLSLIHSTDLLRFKQIRKTKRLKVQPCDVYRGQNLLYFFYGRPAYRPHAKEKTLSARAYAPVCLVFNKVLAEQAIRILPFDSGAFHLRVTHPPMHPEMSLGEFELAINANAPMKLIKVFFGTETNYFDERPIPTEYPYDNFQVDSFYRLIRLGDNREADDRISAIEIQFNKDIVLKNKIEAVVLPGPYLDRPGVAKQIEGWGAIALPYDIQESFKPIETYGAILTRLKDFYRSKGVL
jgi:hypothetical protein